MGGGPEAGTQAGQVGGSDPSKHEERVAAPAGPRKNQGRVLFAVEAHVELPTGMRTPPARGGASLTKVSTIRGCRGVPSCSSRPRGGI
jgi:hypothetical protein